PVRLGPTGGERDRFVDFVYQPITSDDGERVSIFVEGYDVTDHKRAEALRTLHNQVLELAIEDQPLNDTLHSLVRIVERNSTSGVMASILLLDSDGRHLRHAAAPSLDPAYNEAIDGLEI